MGLEVIGSSRGTDGPFGGLFCEIIDENVGQPLLMCCLGVRFHLGQKCFFAHLWQREGPVLIIRDCFRLRSRVHKRLHRTLSAHLGTRSEKWRVVYMLQCCRREKDIVVTCVLS